jgi:hypothetical protein
VEGVPEGVHIDFLRAERSLHRWQHEDVERIRMAERIASREGAGVQMHVLEDAGHWVSTNFNKHVFLKSWKYECFGFICLYITDWGSWSSFALGIDHLSLWIFGGTRRGKLSASNDLYASCLLLIFWKYGHC